MNSFLGVGIGCDCVDGAVSRSIASFSSLCQYLRGDLVSKSCLCWTCLAHAVVALATLAHSLECLTCFAVDVNNCVVSLQEVLAAFEAP